MVERSGFGCAFLVYQTSVADKLLMICVTDYFVVEKKKSVPISSCKLKVDSLQFPLTLVRKTKSTRQGYSFNNENRLDYTDLSYPAIIGRNHR